MIFKLVLVVVVLGLFAAAAAEIITPPVVEEAIEERVNDRVPDATAVEAEVDSFPFVARLLATGRVEKLTVDLAGVERQLLEFALIRVEADGIRLNRSALTGGEVQVRSIDRGTITAEITAGAISDVLGVPVRLTPGRATATVAGAEVTAEVTVAAGVLRLAAGSVSASVTLPRDDLFPCDLSGQVLTGRALLRCTITDVPPVLLELAASAS